jgi:hypothetical protein
MNCPAGRQLISSHPSAPSLRSKALRHADGHADGDAAVRLDWQHGPIQKI